MWGNIEDYYSGSAWDGAWVEISVDGGPFTHIEPMQEYTHTLYGLNTPCWSGDFDWQHVEFDLSEYTHTTIQLRFCFSSDSSMSYEGWYIDDVVISGIDCNASSVPALSLWAILIVVFFYMIILRRAQFSPTM